MKAIRSISIFLSCIALVTLLPAEGSAVDAKISTSPVSRLKQSLGQDQEKPISLSPYKAFRDFPQMLFQKTIDEQIAEDGKIPLSYKLPDIGETEWNKKVQEFLRPQFANNDLVGFYGSPISRVMGILGQYPPEVIFGLLDGYVQLYDEANGPERGVVPVIYIIYGTVQAGGSIGYLKRKIVEKWIALCQERGAIVILDHQIGKGSVTDAMETLLPFLEYPNVELALDPEWHTDTPMEVIGSVTAAELNDAQALMSDYLREQGYPGRRFLVIHQFKEKMIKNRDALRADYPGIDLVHCADGFGNPSLKINTYEYNGRAKNLPIKGFKLFFKSWFEKAGYDLPLLSPEEVFALKPRPSLILYQ